MVKNLVGIWADAKRNLAWQLGSGKSVKFWTDWWIPHVGWIDEQDNIAMDDFSGSEVVADFVALDSGWMWERLAQALPPNTLAYLSVILPPWSEEDDRVYWVGAETDSFSVRSTYVVMNYRL